MSYGNVALPSVSLFSRPDNCHSSLLINYTLQSKAHLAHKRRLQVDGLPVNIEIREGDELKQQWHLPSVIRSDTRILMRARIHLEKGSRVVGMLPPERGKDRVDGRPRPVHES